MKKYAFISRHVPTARQIELAAEKGIQLVHVGDVDGFRGDFRALFPKWEGPKSCREGDETCRAHDKWWAEEAFHGAVVVHAALALRILAFAGVVGVFENGNRAPEGEKPTFEPVELHLFKDNSYMDGAFSAMIDEIQHA